MKPYQKILKTILLEAISTATIEYDGDITEDSVIELYDYLLVGNDLHHDFENEFREGICRTDIPTMYSRHYESYSVASQMFDQSWVGWTYWYGGGKYGEPEAIDWMSGAYDLACTAEERVVTVHTFTKVE